MTANAGATDGKSPSTSKKRGRPRKNSEEAIKDSSKKAQSAQEKYIQALEEKNALLEAELLDKDYDEDISISPTEYIKVMSLLPYRLNLCTKERGQGKVYKFDTLFQIKRIIYSDLSDILEAQRDFLEKGFFIILNKRVVRSNGLDETQAGVLTKEKIEEILSGSSEGISLYSSANDEQQLMIVDMLTDKMVEDYNSVDLNVVDKISRISKINISAKAEDARKLLKPNEAIEDIEE